MGDTKFIKLYRGIYQNKSKVIRNRVGVVCGVLFGLFAINGAWNGNASILGLLQGIVAGFVFNFFLQQIIIQQLRCPKVSQLSIFKKSSASEDFGRIIPELKLNLASAAAFLIATSSFSNPEYISPLVSLPDDEGYPRLHRDFITALIFIFSIAASRTFYFNLFQRNYALRNMDEATGLIVSVPWALLHSFLMVGGSLAISTLFSSLGYDLLYGIWLCFQHVLYTRTFALTNHFLSHLALSGIVLNIFWMVVDELVLKSLVEHLDHKTVIGAGVKTLLSGLSGANDDYVNVFCATELLHHIKASSAFRRTIYGQSSSYEQMPIQPSWTFVSQSLISILDCLSADVQSLQTGNKHFKATNKAANSTSKSNPTAEKSGAKHFSASALLDQARQLILKKLPSFWPHAHEERLNLTQFWAHVSLALGSLASHAISEDLLGIVQWDIQQILRAQLDLFDLLFNYLLMLRQPPVGYDYEDVEYLLNALNKSCREIVNAYQKVPEYHLYVTQDQIQRANSLTFL